MSRSEESSAGLHGSLRSLTSLYERPLPSARTGPLYNAFSYPTKISPEAIAIFIATHTEPGDCVLDCFAGSGTTGLATLLCDRPTPGMLKLAAELELKPKWGPRRGVLYELSVIGSFAAEVMCNPPDPALFEREATALLDAAFDSLRPLLAAEDSNGEPGVLRHIIWSEMLACPACLREHSLWDMAVSHSPLRLASGNEQVECPSCKATTPLDSFVRVTESYFDDLLGAQRERRKRVPVRVHGKSGTRQWQRPVRPSDLETLTLIEGTAIPTSAPIEPLVLGDLYRRGYHFGITHLHHLYTRRNFLSVTRLLQLVEDRDVELRDSLRLLVLSYNQSHSTMMSRVVVKDGGGDFVLTGAQSGVLYVSGLPVEKNVVEGVRRKVKAFKDSFALLRGSRSTVCVRNQSCTSMLEKTDSVAYVFTDPPFADFIPYAEINQINELWLGARTNSTYEAVVSAAQGKGLAEYGGLMAAAFAEIFRVLKNEGAATVVFHAAKASVWAELQRAYRSANLEVAAANVLDKLQASFKQVVSTISVKGDALLLLTKRIAVAQNTDVPNVNGNSHITKFIAESLTSLSDAEREPARLYSRYVTQCLEDGSEVDMDAGPFYALVQAGQAT